MMATGCAGRARRRQLTSNSRTYEQSPFTCRFAIALYVQLAIFKFMSDTEYLLKDENGAIWAYSFKKDGSVSKAGSRRTAEQAADMSASGEAVWETHYSWLQTRATAKQVGYALSMVLAPVAGLREWLSYCSRAEISTVIDLLKEGAL
jgi:hypothetical protein